MKHEREEDLNALPSEEPSQPEQDPEIPLARHGQVMDGDALLRQFASHRSRSALQGRSPDGVLVARQSDGAAGEDLLGSAPVEMRHEKEQWDGIGRSILHGMRSASSLSGRPQRL